MPWDAEILSRIRHLHLRARVLTQGLLAGEHPSRSLGASVEFAEYQDYQRSMDPKWIDWAVWARTDRLVVKKFQAETRLTCVLVLDLSGDLATGTEADRSLPDLEGSKAGYAITLAATLLYFFHRHGEAVGLEIVAGQGLARTSWSARTGRRHLSHLFSALASVKPGGQADLQRSLKSVGNRVHRRSWVGVISDGMEEPEQWLPTLGAFARRRTDLRFIHLFDRREWRLPGDPSLYYSPEGGAALSVEPHSARRAFAQVATEYLRQVRAGVVTWGGQYHPTPTAMALDKVLSRVVLGLPLSVEEAWA